jgi:hypothetical protein
MAVIGRVQIVLKLLEYALLFAVVLLIEPRLEGF